MSVRSEQGIGRTSPRDETGPLSCINKNASNRCACGKPILRIPISSDSPDVQPTRTTKLETVFDRLYNGRISKEMKRRELAAKLAEEEAMKCTYLPAINVSAESHSSRQTASLERLTYREMRMENARYHFQRGLICDDCYCKEVVNTGSICRGNLTPENSSCTSNRTRLQSCSITPPSEIIVVSEEIKESKESMLRERRGRPPMFLNSVSSQGRPEDGSERLSASLFHQAPVPTQKSTVFSFDGMSATSSSHSEQERLHTPMSSSRDSPVHIQDDPTTESQDTSTIVNVHDHGARVTSRKDPIGLSQGLLEAVSEETGSEMELVAVVGIRDDNTVETRGTEFLLLDENTTASRWDDVIEMDDNRSLFINCRGGGKDLVRSQSAGAMVSNYSMESEEPANESSSTIAHTQSDIGTRTLSRRKERLSQVIDGVYPPIQSLPDCIEAKKGSESPLRCTTREIGADDNVHESSCPRHSLHGQVVISSRKEESTDEVEKGEPEPVDKSDMHAIVLSSSENSSHVEPQACVQNESLVIPSYIAVSAATSESAKHMNDIAIVAHTVLASFGANAVADKVFLRPAVEPDQCKRDFGETHRDPPEVSTKVPIPSIGDRDVHFDRDGDSIGSKNSILAVIAPRKPKKESRDKRSMASNYSIDKWLERFSNCHLCGNE